MLNSAQSSKTLIIVESPAKTKTIQKIVGNQYIVTACFGHVRDLDPKKMSIDVNNQFKPTFTIMKDKNKVVRELRRLAKSCKEVVLAADEDREGEAIAASIAEILGLKNPKRIVFNSITKTAILDAIKNPKTIDYAMVDAQQARRFLDRIVGYDMSPLLCNHYNDKLSAGRVQSVVLKMVVEKEKELQSHLQTLPQSCFKLKGTFNITIDDKPLIGIMHCIQKKVKQDRDMMTQNPLKGPVWQCKELPDAIQTIELFGTDAQHSVHSIVARPTERFPPLPYITSSLQQDANGKLNFGVKKTMDVAQKLYEAGHITYMRTDSKLLSSEAQTLILEFITNRWGPDYITKVCCDGCTKDGSTQKNNKTVKKSKKTTKTTKTKQSKKEPLTQDAHEAIRPTNVKLESIEGPPEQQKLYSLIWKRAVASMMAPAVVQLTTIQMGQPNPSELYFESKFESITFPGYLVLYGKQVESSVIPIKVGDIIDRSALQSTQEYASIPPRYNEATLVKKMDESSIGRPSTFASIINKVMDRKYIEIMTISGQEYPTTTLLFKAPWKKIKKSTKVSILGAEKNKMVPTPRGIEVCEFLEKHFTTIMDYQFTAAMEHSLDDIADRKASFLSIMNKFYNDFSPLVQQCRTFVGIDGAGEANRIAKPANDAVLLGSVDAKDVGIMNLSATDIDIYATTTRYGPAVMLIHPVDQTPKYASATKKVTLKQAVNLLKYPLQLGAWKKHAVMLHKGRYGEYLKWNDLQFSYNGVGSSQPKDRDEGDTITTLKSAKKILKQQLKTMFLSKDQKFRYQIKQGPYGPYVMTTNLKTKKSTNASLPGGVEIVDGTVDNDVMEHLVGNSVVSMMQ